MSTKTHRPIMINPGLSDVFGISNALPACEVSDATK